MRISWLPILPLSGHVFSLSLISTAPSVSASDVENLKGRTGSGIHVPIYRRESRVRKRDNLASIGLGDDEDIAYFVLLRIGMTETPFHLDTGSSDLWVVSDACTGNCTTTVPLYPQSSFQSTGLDLQLFYGDSQTATFAFGTIGKDTVGLAGLSLNDQYFGAINRTNTSVLESGAAGIFGVGFPVTSGMWMNLTKNHPVPVNRRSEQGVTSSSSAKQRRREHDHFSFPSYPIRPRQETSSASALSASFGTFGPFFSRLSLASPMFSVLLQRDTIDIGGNLGQLSIGELPAGVKQESLTWTNVRRYNQTEGGLTPPPDAPNEVYPLNWEIPLDDVYFDGQKLPRSNLSSPSISLSALVDTGSTLIRGPSDVVDLITQRTGGDDFPCSNPHTLAFQFSGKLFPVDPRDFISQSVNNVLTCSATLVSTDPPDEGDLHSWSLGDPFLKGVLSSFYYGDFVYPSKDPPRIGFLSTVPPDADQKLKDASNAASAAGNNFPASSERAPSGTFIPASTLTNGVPQASSKSNAGQKPKNSARRVRSTGSLVVKCAVVFAFLEWVLS